jgi:dihydrofolate reductase
MRKVIAATYLSIDGVMQAPGAPEEDISGGFKFGGWTVPYWDGSMMRILGAGMPTQFDLLLGRKTYDVFSAHWPYMPKDDPIASVFNGTTKFVATSSPDTLTWENSQPLRGEISEAITKLKNEGERDLLIQGSSVLVHSLLRTRLIDEFHLWTFPVILGTGKRLFDGSALPSELKLVGSTTSDTGVVVSSYMLAGDVRLGSFAAEKPSAAELERRARQARRTRQ